MQNKDLKKDIGLGVVLISIFFVLLYITVPEGGLYGSNIDWLSQHVNIAETLRNEMINQQTLFLDFIWLGGGNNAYNFSYYGYLRPDVLFGCLLPGVPMGAILITVMMFSFLATVLLCYYWLRKKGITAGPAFLGAVFCMTTACFFHFHRQIMFVNYMPLLFLALVLTERTIKKRSILLYCLILSGICFQSYYYSISCFIVVILYWLQVTRKKEDLFLLFKMLVLSVGTSCILLLPTFLALLENKRASGGIDLKALITPKLNLQGMLYSPYGIGFSMIILYLLMVGLLHKNYRKGSILCIILFVFPIIPYLLNGTLYARYKILMPFLPLILLHCVKVLQGVWNEEIKPTSRLAFLMLVFGAAAIYFSSGRLAETTSILILFDMVLILLFSWLWKWKNKALVYTVLLIAPVLATVSLSTEEEFVTEKQVEDIFTEKELKEYAKEEWARTDYLKQPLINANQIQYPNQKTTGMYSSVTNKNYAEFYFDIMQTPIRINNRVALLPESNPFLQYLMGVRYIVTMPDKRPYGYRPVMTKNNSVIAENENVLPLAYLSLDTISREQFNTLKFPYSVEGLIRYTVVEDVPGAEKKQDFTNPRFGGISKTSKIEKRDLHYTIVDYPKNFTWKTKKNGIEITAKEDCEGTIHLNEVLNYRIGILTFEVVNKGKGPVEIAINGIRNKLSAPGAPYPNGNNRFTYYLDENMDEDLKIECKKGKFLIKNLKYYAFPRTHMVKGDVLPITLNKTKGNQVLNCTTDVQRDTYFVTSVPYQRGMEVYVDGKRRDVLLMNTAFVGTYLEGGNHKVVVKFIPPGKRLGMTMSIVAILLIALSEVLRIRKKRSL